MIITAGIFVVLRCSTRLWFSKFGWDDVLIVISLVSSFVMARRFFCARKLTVRNSSSQSSCL